MYNKNSSNVGPTGFYGHRKWITWIIWSNLSHLCSPFFHLFCSFSQFYLQSIENKRFVDSQACCDKRTADVRMVRARLEMTMNWPECRWVHRTMDVENAFEPIQVATLLFVANISDRSRREDWSNTSKCCLPLWKRCTKRRHGQAKRWTRVHSADTDETDEVDHSSVRDASDDVGNHSRPQRSFLPNIRTLDWASTLLASDDDTSASLTATHFYATNVWREFDVQNAAGIDEMKENKNRKNQFSKINFQLICCLHFDWQMSTLAFPFPMRQMIREATQQNTGQSQMPEAVISHIIAISVLRSTLLHSFCIIYHKIQQ